MFLYTAAALACTDLIVNGVLERHPDLRLGIVELSAVWVPMYLMMLDGGVDFTTRLNGFAPAELSLRPSEYFRRQVRVSSFSYELPGEPPPPARGRGPADGVQRLSRTPRAPRHRSPTTRRTGKFGTDPEHAPGPVPRQRRVPAPDVTPATSRSSAASIAVLNRSGASTIG